MFIVNHPDSAEPLTLATRDEVATWAQGEAQFWSNLGISGLRAAENYARSATTDLQRLIEQSKRAEVSDADLASRLDEIAPKYFLSTGKRGNLLELLRTLGHHSRTITAALTALLQKTDELQNVILNGHWTVNCATGIAAAMALEAGAEPRYVVSLIQSVDEYKREWHRDLEHAKEQTRRNKGDS